LFVFGSDARDLAIGLAQHPNARLAGRRGKLVWAGTSMRLSTRFVERVDAQELVFFGQVTQRAFSANITELHAAG
jgi:hypothetical protein